LARIGIAKEKITIGHAKTTGRFDQRRYAARGGTIGSMR
jgi:hypothetical protein